MVIPDRRMRSPRTAQTVARAIRESTQSPNRPAPAGATGFQAARMAQHARMVAVVTAKRWDGGTSGAGAQGVCGAPLPRGTTGEPADGIGAAATVHLRGHGGEH